MGTKYQKGARREYAIKSKLEKKGYFVMRSAGSHGPADLIAIHPMKNKVKLIQSKVGTLSTKQKIMAQKGLKRLEGGFYTVTSEVWDDEKYYA